jgi:transposase-like protein
MSRIPVRRQLRRLFNKKKGEDASTGSRRRNVERGGTMSDTKTDENHVGEQVQTTNPKECPHTKLAKVEASGINEVDTDVSLYTCAACGKSFTITDF